MLPGGASSEESACNARDAGDSGLIPESGWSPGEGNGNPLWHSCLENLMDRGAWWDAVYMVTKSQTQLKRLSVQEATEIFLSHHERYSCHSQIFL